MKSVVLVSIVGETEEALVKTRDRLIKRHLLAGLSYNECSTVYWKGGQIMQSKSKIVRGITFHSKIEDIVNVLPSGVEIISVCESTYVNPKTERWLNESVR